MNPQQVNALEGVIEEARTRLHIPGAALGILQHGDIYAAGFGVTSVENPLPVDADTLFQIGSVSKTFCGTTAMRLVEMDKLDLDAPIRTYLPDLKLSSEELTAQITLRHLFTHTSGWEGDYFLDYGSGDDAGARYVAEMGSLPQYNPPGTLWSYNNAGFNLAGHVIEVVAGKPYEAVVKELVFDPLGMTRSFFFPGDVMTYRFSVGHRADENPTVARPWPLPRASNAAGAIASTIGDLLRYARFYLSGGLAESGERLLQEETIRFMQSALFPAGNWAESVGVTWYLRSVGSVRLVGHGGSTNGFQATFQLAPAQDFAFVALTNTSNGSVFYGDVLDWALENLLGTKAAAPPLLSLSDAELAEYVGSFQAALTRADVSLVNHGLQMQVTSLGGFPTRDTPPASVLPAPAVRLGFYERDRAVILDSAAHLDHLEYLRDASGKIVWLRTGGRIHRPL